MYSGPFLEYIQIDHWTSKLMTMREALHRKDIRLCASRGKKPLLTDMEDYVDASIKRIEVYIKEKQRKTSYSSQFQHYQKLRIKNGEKNNCMEISSDKLVISHTKRHGLDFERKNSRGKRNLF